MKQRARNWFLTINNYSEDEKDFCVNYDKSRYLIVAEEVGEQGTPHLHLYLEYKNAVYFDSLKKQFPRANIQVAKGDSNDNYNYLAKQNLVVERGTRKQPGKRNDLEEVRELVRKGSTMRDIIATATSYQAIRSAEKVIYYYEAKREFQPNVKWFYGPTGSGKTRTAYDELREKYQDVYFCMDTNAWWQGYDGHEGVIMDDLRRDFCKFHTLLRILDRYPYQVETKGGSRQLLAKDMIITCPYHPAQLYDGREDINQLLRRISEVREFT